MRDSSDRYSVFLLEGDVNKFQMYRNLYNRYKYLSKIPLIGPLFIKKEKFYYKKYLKWMQTLENKYRHNDIITDFHETRPMNNPIRHKRNNFVEP